MDETTRTILSVWGAVLATVLAIMQIVKHVRDKPRIHVESDLSFSAIDDSAETKGTKVETKHGWQEILLSVRAANHGYRAMQITACVVEEANGNITQVIPDQLPVVLDPNTSTQFHIQKEWLDDTEVSRFGVLDALGRVHQIDNQSLLELIRRCKELPSNKKPYHYKETGEVVKAFQVKDKVAISKRRKDT